jgi:hypothetical protein
MAITTNVPPTQRGYLELGTDCTLNFTMTTPMSILGWTILFEFFDTSGNLIFSKSTTAGTITFTNTSTGVIAVQIFDTDTALLSPANYNTWLHRTDSGFMTPLAKVVFYLRNSLYE